MGAAWLIPIVLAVAIGAAEAFLMLAVVRTASIVSETLLLTLGSIILAISLDNMRLSRLEEQDVFDWNQVGLVVSLFMFVGIVVVVGRASLSDFPGWDLAGYGILAPMASFNWIARIRLETLREP